MSNMVKYGIGAAIVAGAIGGGAVWYMNNAADKIAAELLQDAEQFVAENMNGATLSYSNYSSSGMSRSVTIFDVSLAHEDGTAITMDSITIAGNEDMISITDATNINMLDNSKTLGQIKSLDIINFAIPDSNIMLMLMDQDALINSINVDEVSLRDASFDIDGETLTIASLDMNNIKNASGAISMKNMRFGGYIGAFAVDDFTVDNIDFIPLFMEDEEAIARDILGISDLTVKGLMINAGALDFDLAEFTINDVTRDNGLITSANINMESLKMDIASIVGDDMAPMFMMLGITDIDMSGSTAYEISLSKGSVSGSMGLGVKGLGKIDMSAAFAGLTKDKYEDMIMNAAYLDAEDYIEDYGLGLDSMSVDYKDDSLADTLLDIYSGGNRAGLAEEVSGMISFYGMMSQQAELANAVAPAIGNFIRGGNQFSFTLKAKQSLTEDVITEAMMNGSLQDIITITASGS